MDLPAIKMTQSGTKLYLTNMTAGQLLAHCHTAEWDPALGWDIEHQGFQRAPVPQHYETIGNFLNASPDPFIPTAALLSGGEDRLGVLPFKLVDKSRGFGVLTIPDARQLLILDYQHRWRGLQHAIDELGAKHLSDFVVPAIILPNIPRFEEIRQFYLINSKQRRIDTDLALALLQTLAGHVTDEELVNLVGRQRRYRIRGTRLTFALAARLSGPWLGRIRQPHDLPQPETVIKVKSFVDSLARILSPRNSCSQMSDDDLLDVLTKFWQALADHVPEAFQAPTDYQIQRTVGAFVFHRVFALKVYDKCKAQGRLTRPAFRDALQPAVKPYISRRFWTTGGRAGVYVGGSGFNELARLIMQKL